MPVPCHASAVGSSSAENPWSSKLLVVLDHIAQRFEPGTTYTEAEVNEVLTGFHDDYAALRRYLVDGQFLTRENNVYWRSGGTVPV